MNPELYWPLVALILGLAAMGSLWALVLQASKVRAATALDERVGVLETDMARALEKAEKAEEYANGIAKRIAGIEHLTRWSKRA